MQPVRDALDYYKRLNEASKDARSRRSIEQASPDTSAATSPAQNNSCGGGGDDATADTDQERCPIILYIYFVRLIIGVEYAFLPFVA